MRLTAYLLSFFLFSKLNLNKKFLSQTILVSSITILVIGILQYIFLPDLRFLYYLGWDDHLNRLTFPYFDPNFTGIILAVFFLYFQRSKYRLLAPLFLLATFFTYSRSALLSLLLAFILFAKNKLSRYLILGLFVFGLLLLPKRFGEGNNLLRTYSIKARFVNDFVIFQQSLKNPFVGIKIEREDSPFINRSGTANNSFIYLFEVSGIFGFATFLYFLKQLISHSSNKQIWTLLLIASLFNNVLFYPFVLLWIILLDSMDAKSISS